MSGFSDRPDRLDLGTLLADGRYDGCPCGTGARYFGEGSGARTRHANWHLAWDRGAPIPAAVFWFDSLAIVTGESNVAERKIGYQLGRLFQKENHYDFPMAPDPRSWPGNLSEVLIAVYHGHAIGGLFTYPTLRYGVWDGTDGTVEFNVRLTEPQPMISGIWVARGYRRRGVGTALVGALAEYAAIPPHDLIWGVPFSDDGKALALTVAGSHVRIG